MRVGDIKRGHMCFSGVERVVTRRHGCKGTLPEHPFAPGLPHRARFVGLGQHFEQRLRERVGRARRNERSVDAVAHDLAVAADIGGDDRQSGRARLEQCNGITFRQ